MQLKGEMGKERKEKRKKDGQERLKELKGKWIDANEK